MPLFTLTPNRNNCSAKHITLQFLSIDDLWAFRIEALISFIEMDAAKKTLTCLCTNEHMQLAVKKYKAAIMMPEREN